MSLELVLKAPPETSFRNEVHKATYGGLHHQIGRLFFMAAPFTHRRPLASSGAVWRSQFPQEAALKVNGNKIGLFRVIRTPPSCQVLLRPASLIHS